MKLKDYQQDVVDRLGNYLRELEAAKKKTDKQIKVLTENDLDIPAGLDPNKDAWVAGQRQGIVQSTLPYKAYSDGVGRPVPNLCLKVPTGGGKTLIAAHAVGAINNDYFKRQTGFVLWIVPSDAIYQQTKAQLAQKSHPFRQVLERLSGGRVKFFEKGARFTKVDTDNYLCVMLMMLQASNRKTKETLKMFQDSGGYSDFFPEVDDYAALNALWQAVPNLDRYDLGDGEPNVNTGIAVKQSLGNALRLIRPIIVIDEGHKAYSDGARETLTGFNPRLMLELSATPNAKNHRSNVLCDVSGMALKKEEMIKLPIVLEDHHNKGWKDALEAAWAQIETLQADADESEDETGRHIRPILLIRVDRTGKEQRDNDFLHAEDVREHLTNIMGVQPNAVRVKSASMDEIAGEDLMSQFSPVRVIITKDALREGWDCPFAYVLAVLSRTTATTALTQMIGRVLRQPYVTRTAHDSLNRCYVHCLDQDVSDVVGRIRKGLQSEGMEDIADEILGAGDSKDATPMQELKLTRREGWKGRKIFLPRVLVQTDTELRRLDYDRDILGGLDWDKFRYDEAKTITLVDDDSASTVAIVDLKAVGQNYDLGYEAGGQFKGAPKELERPFLIRKLIDVIPNPWQAARILDEAVAVLSERYDIAQIIASKLTLIDSMKEYLRGQVDKAARAVFEAKVKSGEITFRLTGDAMDHVMAESLTVLIPEGAGLLTRFGKPLEKPLYQSVYKTQLNSLEQSAAIYLDGKDPLKWWHRVAVSQSDYHLQGWKRSKVYPDFLCWLDLDADGDASRLLVLETKGKHLDNPDTEWKRDLFEVLEDAYVSGDEIGKLDLVDKQAEKISFKLIMQTEEDTAWKPRLEKVFK